MIGRVIALSIRRRGLVVVASLAVLPRRLGGL